MRRHRVNLPLSSEYLRQIAENGVDTQIGGEDTQVYGLLGQRFSERSSRRGYGKFRLEDGEVVQPDLRPKARPPLAERQDKRRFVAELRSR